MNLKILKTRSSAALTRLRRVSVIVRWPAEVVERQQVPYWQEHGWTKERNRYNGRYNTPYGAFEGCIEERPFGTTFYLHQPSEKLLRSSHGACFQPREDGWHAVHMRIKPRDVSSGIVAIERVISDAYRG